MPKILFSPFRLRGIEFRNRIVVSPMCQYSSEDGFATNWHLVHLGSRAVGGAALVFSEATAVSSEGRISISDLGIWKDEHVENLKRITDFIRGQEAVAGIQLAHAGRKASRTAPWSGDQRLTPPDAWQVLAPLAIPFSPEYDVPKAMDEQDIEKVIRDFREAAVRALQAGFQVAEIHAAHGYLLHEFLSPITNKRNDGYGGNLENRCRLPVEVVKAVRSVWPDHLPLFVRISCTDWDASGLHITDAVEIAKKLKAAGADLIDCSSGGLIPGVKIPATAGYQVPFADAVKKNAGIPTGAVGLILTAAQAEEILQQEHADLILMAREFLRDPYFAMRNASAGDNVRWPVQYVRGKR